jgi:Zn-dependent protease with chaperone function
MLAKGLAPSAAVLSLLLAALPCRAGQPLDGPELPLFTSIARRIAGVSSYPLKNSLRVLYYAGKRPNEDLDGGTVEGIPAHFHKSPASSYAPHETYNQSDIPALVITEYIFHYARDQDEAAFMIAHEFSHLQLSHAEAYHMEFCRAYRSLMGRQAACTQSDAEIERLKELAPDESSRLDRLESANETAADANALSLSVAAGYDPHAAERIFRNMDELHRKYEFKPSATHPEPLDRLKALQSRIDQFPPAR